jgi:tetratricopeptide (TPR) repeat protein
MCFADRVTMADMFGEATPNRLVTALRIALYPALEPAESRRFEALVLEAENARSSGDLAKTELLYSTAATAAQSLPDPSYLSRARDGLGRVYQAQHRYREAESIFRDQLQAASDSSQPNTLVHAGHMSLALLYAGEGRFPEAEDHYNAALAETEKAELFPGRGFWCSTAMWLAKFYVKQQRYGEAEPLFQRALEIHEADQGPNSYLPHHLQEFAKFYELQGKYEAAERLYRRALDVCERLHGISSLHTIRALDAIAAFCRARGRYPEAEDFCRLSLARIEEQVGSQAARWTRGWQFWRNRKELEVKAARNQIPISTALDRLAAVYEDRQKYVESEPLRKRSLEINERAWGELHPSFLVESLEAHAKALHETGRDHEASEIARRIDALRLKYPQGSARCVLRAAARPVRRNLRWRFTALVSAFRYPSRF